jgi:hypothetical protein
VLDRSERVRLNALQDLRALEREHGDALEDRRSTKQCRVAYFRVQALEFRTERDEGDVKDIRVEVRGADQTAGRDEHRTQLK